MSKTCIHCNITKPVEEFHIHKTAKTGYKNVCKMCTSAQKAKRYLEHREEHLGKVAQYRAENPEKVRACVRASYQVHKEERAEARKVQYEIHKEELCAYQKIYRTEHPGIIRAYREKNREKHNAMRRARYVILRDSILSRHAAYRKNNHQKRKQWTRNYYAKNMEKIKRANKIWTNNNREKVHEYEHRHRARKANAPINDFNKAQWKEIILLYNSRCVYCGGKRKTLTEDHLTPLSKGGNHTASNILPACQSCNSKKSTNGPLTPVQPVLLTVAPASRIKY